MNAQGWLLGRGGRMCRCCLPVRAPNRRALLRPPPPPQGRYHFVSSDYGASFKALPTPGDTAGFAHEIRLHPRQPDWLLAKVQRNQCILDRRRCGVCDVCARVCVCWLLPTAAASGSARAPHVALPCASLPPPHQRSLSPVRSPLCAYDLFLSQDFAGTWANLTAQSGGRVASFRDYDWGCKLAK